FVYRKDFICEYLLAHALRAGVNPYLGLNDLAGVLHIALPAPIFAHPTPHPPGLALFSIPLAWLTYLQAATAWFGLELACPARGGRRALFVRPGRGAWRAGGGCRSSGRWARRRLRWWAGPGCGWAGTGAGWGEPRWVWRSR